MEAKMNQFFQSVTTLFGGGDNIPWSTPDDIVGCEREVADAEKDGSDERVKDGIMQLSWALVHSRKPEDMQRGIAMLEDSLTSNNSPLQTREKLYLLAVGHYRSGEYPRSLHFLNQCLEVQDWSQALSLKKTVEETIAKDNVIGIMGVAATAVTLIATGVAAALARKG